MNVYRWRCQVGVVLLAACSAPPAMDAGMDVDAGSDAGLIIDAGPPDAGPPDAGSAFTVYGCDGGNGTIGARFRGAAVYCQMNDDFGYYQCDELANRYMRDVEQHANIDNAAVDFASTMCAKAALKPGYTVNGPGTGRRPFAGDLAVWSGAPGHVALVTGTSTTIIDFAQQNLPTLLASAGWDPAASWFDGGATTLPFGTIRCWIHADPAPPAPPPDGGACGCFAGASDYCGLSIVNRSWWTGCSPGVAVDPSGYDDLYSCDGGVFTRVRTCPTLCTSRSINDNTGFCR